MTDKKKAIPKSAEKRPNARIAEDSHLKRGLV